MARPNILIFMPDHQRADTAINAYITVSLAPWGPAEAFR